MPKPTTLATSVLPGAGYVHLDEPVAVPCIITLSPGTSFAEKVPVYKCSDDSPYVALLGVDNPHGRPLVVQLKRAHSAGSPVWVETAGAEPEDQAHAAPDLMQQIQDLIRRRPSIFPGMSRPGKTYDRYKAWSDRSAAALLAVLELHKPVKGWNLHCGECFYPDTTAQPWPCDTVEAIAKELGIGDCDA